MNLHRAPFCHLIAVAAFAICLVAESAEPLRIEIERVGPDVTLRIFGPTDISFHLQQSDDLRHWGDRAIFRIPSGGLTTNLSAANSVVNQFFRVVAPTSPPVAPSALLAAAVSEFTIQLTWGDQSSDEDGFALERALNGAPFTFFDSVGPGYTVFFDNTVEPGGTYSYRLKSFNSAGQSLPAMSGALVIQVPPPTPPSLLASVEPDGTVHLEWTGVVGVQFYRLSRSQGDEENQLADDDELVETSFVDADARSGSAIYFVQAVNAGGASDRTASSPVVIPKTDPFAPSGLALSTTSLGNVRAEWTDNTEEEDHFELWRSIDGNNFNLKENVPPAAGVASRTHAVDDQISLGNRYWYKVRAVDDVGEPTGFSSSIFIDVPETVPGEPTGFSLRLTGVGDVEASWLDNSDDEERFELWRSTTGVSFSLKENVPSRTGTGGRPSALDDTVSDGTTYWFKARAIRSGRPTAFSNVDSIAVPSRAPSALTLRVTSRGNVEAEWTDNSGDEDRFELWRATGTGSFVFQENVPASNGVGGRTSAVDDTVALGTSYSYRVRAIRGGTPTAFSATQTIAVPSTVPGTPSGLSVRLTSNGNADVAWTDNTDDEDRFELWRSTDGQHFAFQENVPAQAGIAGRTGAVDDTVVDGATYWFKVRAIRGGKPTDFSNAEAVTVPSRAPFALNLRVTSRGNVEAEWTDNTADESYFELWRSEGGGFVLQENVPAKAGSGSRVSAVDDTVGLSRTYSYKVRAIRGSSPTAFSNTETITVPATVPGGPTALSLRVTSAGNVEATWTDNTDDEERFEVWRSPDGSSFSLEENVPAQAGVGSRTSAVDTTVDDGHTYWYRVRAIRGGKPTDFSNVTAITVPSLAPSDLALRITSAGNVQATWTDNTNDELRFELYRSPDGSGFALEENVPAKDGVGTRTSAVDTTISAGRTYWYKVRAVRSAGPTAFSPALSIAVPR